MWNLFGKSTDSNTYYFESHSTWYHRTTEKITALSNNLDKRTIRKYRLDILPNIVRRLDMYGDICDTCQTGRNEISELVDTLGNIIQQEDSDRIKDHLATIERFIKHFQSVHHLVKKGHYTGIISLFGIALGGAAGVLFKDFEYASIVTPIVLILIGMALDYKAKREDRVI